MIYSRFSRYKYIHTDRVDIRHGPSRVACTNVCKAWAKSDKNWWPAHVIVSQIRNILMPVGSLDDDWLKSYAHNEFVLKNVLKN
jgi:hypothetical protein